MLCFHHIHPTLCLVSTAQTTQPGFDLNILTVETVVQNGSWLDMNAQENPISDPHGNGHLDMSHARIPSDNTSFLPPVANSERNDMRVLQEDDHDKLGDLEIHKVGSEKNPKSYQQVDPYQPT